MFLSAPQSENITKPAQTPLEPLLGLGIYNKVFHVFIGIPKYSSGWLFHTSGQHATVISCKATFGEHFLTPCALNQPPFDGTIQLYALPDKSLFPHPYPTGQNQLSLAEEGNHTSLYSAEEIDDITQHINCQFNKSIPEAITFHSQATSQLAKELDGHDKRRNFTCSVITRVD